MVATVMKMNVFCLMTCPFFGGAKFPYFWAPQNLPPLRFSPELASLRKQTFSYKIGFPLSQAGY